MSAIIYGAAAWKAALCRRRRAGIRRILMLQQAMDGSWAVGAHERLNGKWLKPDWLASRVAYDRALMMAVSACKRTGLPLLVKHAGKRAEPLKIDGRFILGFGAAQSPEHGARPTGRLLDDAMAYRPRDGAA